VEAVGLIMDRGRCVGIDARRNGAAERYTAKAVIVADGGFQANLEMLKNTVTPQPTRIKVRATPSGTGDGIRMARSVGAHITEVGAFYGHVQAREAMTDDRLWPYPNIDIAATAAIVVDGTGKRFVDEGRGAVFITNAIAKAQKKVEGHNFEIRKHLLEYDNVMNSQRRVIYALRRDILSDTANMDFVEEMIEDVAVIFVDQFRPARNTALEDWPWDEINKMFQQNFNTTNQLTAAECLKNFDEETPRYVAETAKKIIREKFSQFPPDQVRLATREVLLSIFDSTWKNHLLSMDHLKDGVHLRSYAQKDPLLEYKRESFTLFEQMRIDIKKAIVQTMFYIKLYTHDEIEELQKRHQHQLESQLEAHKRAQQQKEGNAAPVKRSPNKVGRNDPCPCGSGKKFKHCHGG
ncbi:MAG: FAD-binding protein, partial [Pseudomonadota bacterium]